ncbi:MAG: hypothetical protein D6806_05025 [Deltaproteobacteria bacterium]|nr:MAG: hypothetical protein D6806_05025 [Deltaproteobacteria bacterium]
MNPRPIKRCLDCKAPIQFRPGAGSRLCWFCGTINLVREQTVAVPQIELRTDEIFMLVQLGRPELALEKAEALLSDTSRPRLMFYRALAQLRAGKLTEGIYSLVDLTGEDAPRWLHADTQATLAEALLKAGRLQESLEAASRALQLEPCHSQALCVLASAELQSGREAKAVAAAERALECLGKPVQVSLPPRGADVLLLLVRCYRRAGRPQKVVDTLKTLLLRHGGATLDELADSLILLGHNLDKLDERSEVSIEVIRMGLVAATKVGREALELARVVVESKGGLVQELMQEAAMQRQAGEQEIREVLPLAAPHFDVIRAEPGAGLELLGDDPDRRVDVLQNIVARLRIENYDRGTLYPLKTFENLRQWIAISRAREYLLKVDREQREQQRLQKLKAAREVQNQRSATFEAALRLNSSRARRRRRAARMLLGVVALVLAAVAGLVVLDGGCWLARFSGRLVDIRCAENGQCSLIVELGGGSGSGVTGLVDGLLLRGRTDPGGRLRYPLTGMFHHIEASAFRRCVGRLIWKARFTHAPSCP